jgi:hypothetical protein
MSIAVPLSPRRWVWLTARSLGALSLIAERRPLFGFMEPGYNPASPREVRT